MSHALRIFIPAARMEAVYPTLVQALGGGKALRIEKPLPLLKLSELRCLNFQLEGSGEHVRTPLVFPLVHTQQFNFDSGVPSPHLFKGVDWLILGNRQEDLVRYLEEVRLGMGAGHGFCVVPYLALRGPLPQEAAQGEPRLQLRKNPSNFNQKTWATTCRQLMTLPEERWGEVGISNTADLVHVFEPALERLLPEPPRRIIDLGCGLGQVARTLAQRYPEAEVTGLDASAEAIAVARNTFCLPNLSFDVADISDPLPFKPGRVDLIVSTNALPYARNQLAAARGLMGLLSPRGLLLNHCRCEESHLFWDFPKSALLPNNTQIFLADWLRAADEAGLATEVSSISLGTSAHFYLSKPFTLFDEAMEAFAAPRRSAVPQPFSPLYSHVLLAHSRLAQPADKSLLPLADNHLERLQQVLRHIAQAPKEGQYAALVTWSFIFKSFPLFPEALDFLVASLPEAAPILNYSLGQGLCA